MALVGIKKFLGANEERVSMLPKGPSSPFSVWERG